MCNSFFITMPPGEYNINCNENKMATPEVQKTPPKSSETSGLLMSIIRTLSSSADVKQREWEKTRLEKAYRESDTKLDKLVQEHLTDLTSIIQAFSKISTRVSTCQEKIRSIKDNLQSCKNLLHCKRDELRKLWIDGVEQKTIVAMLDQIEQVNGIGDKLQGYIDKKHYLHAADLLVSSVSLLEGDLADVEALRNVKVELLAKKEELYERLIAELHRQIYVKSTRGVEKGFQRQGSLRQSKRSEKTAYLKLALQNASSKAREEQETLAERQLSRLKTADLEEISKPQNVTEDLHVDPEEDPVQFIAIIVESLAMLKKLPETVDSLRSHIKPGLMSIVHRASQQVADNAYVDDEDLSQVAQPQFLLDLLELLFRQFRVVARTHQIVLANQTRIKDSMSSLGDFCLYDMVEVWIKIQSVLQLFLSDYLDLRNTASTRVQGSSGFYEPASNLGAYFSKKRPARPKKFALFRFDASSHAISLNSYFREQRQEFYGSGEVLSHTGNVTDNGKPQFVCKPCSSNITVIYNTLQKFIKEIESATKAVPGSLTLQAFITEFIQNIYLNHIMDKIQTSIDLATKGFDALRTIIDLRTQRELNVPKPLLQSTVFVARSLQELQDLMQDLPDYADQFLDMICRILQEYRDTCQQAYASIVTSNSEEKRVISATWAKDEDISRLIKTLPNWRNLTEDCASEEEMSEEDMRAMNIKESNILTSNLSSSDAFIPQSEIISDTTQLRTLANLCESMEWFSGHIDSLATSMSRSDLPSLDILKNQQLPPVSENALSTLRSLSQKFQDLADVCLLALHLEVRVHCFYQLIPLAKQSNYSGAIDDMDPDSHVIKLNKDLTSIEEILQLYLQTKKFRYIFEGLGHLVSSILINSTQYLKKINENGIKKMCRNIFAVQQCLTNITMNRESDLDHARQYYELLYLTPEMENFQMREKYTRWRESVIWGAMVGQRVCYILQSIQRLLTSRILLETTSDPVYARYTTFQESSGGRSRGCKFSRKTSSDSDFLQFLHTSTPHFLLSCLWFFSRDFVRLRLHTMSAHKNTPLYGLVVLSLLAKAQGHEIVKSVVDRGPKFTEQEYTSLLHLAYRSEMGMQGTSLDKLLQIIQSVLNRKRKP